MIRPTPDFQGMNRYDWNISRSQNAALKRHANWVTKAVMSKKSVSSVQRVTGFDVLKSGYVTRRAASSITRLHAQNHPRGRQQKAIIFLGRPPDIPA
jgi:hypothetical protein